MPSNNEKTVFLLDVDGTLITPDKNENGVTTGTAFNDKLIEKTFADIKKLQKENKEAEIVLFSSYKLYYNMAANVEAGVTRSMMVDYLNQKAKEDGLDINIDKVIISSSPYAESIDSEKYPFGKYYFNNVKNVEEQYLEKYKENEKEKLIYEQFKNDTNAYIKQLTARLKKNIFNILVNKKNIKSDIKEAKKVLKSLQDRIKFFYEYTKPYAQALSLEDENYRNKNNAEVAEIIKKYAEDPSSIKDKEDMMNYVLEHYKAENKKINIELYDDKPEVLEVAKNIFSKQNDDNLKFAITRVEFFKNWTEGKFIYGLEQKFSTFVTASPQNLDLKSKAQNIIGAHRNKSDSINENSDKFITTAANAALSDDELKKIHEGLKVKPPIEPFEPPNKPLPEPPSKPLSKPSSRNKL